MQNLKFDIPIWEGFKAAKIEFSSKINGISDCIVIDEETLCVIDFSLNLFFLDYGNKKSKVKCPSFGEKGTELCNFKVTFQNLFYQLYGRNMTNLEYKEYTKKCYSPLKKELCIFYLGDHLFFTQPLTSTKCCIFDLKGEVIQLRHKFDDPHCLKFYSKYMLMYMDKLGRVFLWNWKLDKRKILIDATPMIPINALKFPNGNLLFLLNCPDAREILYKSFILNPVTLKIEQEKYIKNAINKPKMCFSQFNEEYIIYFCAEEEENGTAYLQIEFYQHFQRPIKKKLIRLLWDFDYEGEEYETEISYVSEDIIMIFYQEQHRLCFYRITENNSCLRIWTCDLIETTQDMGYQVSYFHEITYLSKNYFIFYKNEQSFISLFLGSFDFLESKESVKGVKEILKYRKNYDNKLVQMNPTSALTARINPDITMKPLVPSPRAIIKYAVSQDNCIYIINDEGMVLRYNVGLSKFEVLFEVSQKVMKNTNQIFINDGKMIFDLGYLKTNSVIVICDMEAKRQARRNFSEVNYDGNVLLLHSKFGLVVQQECKNEETWICHVDRWNKFQKIIELKEDDEANEFDDFKYFDNCCELDEKTICGLTVNGNLQIYDLKQQVHVRTRVFDDAILNGGDDIPDDVEADHNGNAEYLAKIKPDILALFISRDWFSFVLYNWRQNQIVFVRSCLNSFCKGVISDYLICKNFGDDVSFFINWKESLKSIDDNPDQAIDINSLVPFKVLEENDFEPNSISKLGKNLTVLEDFAIMPGSLYVVKKYSKKLEILNILSNSLKNVYDGRTMREVFEYLF